MSTQETAALSEVQRRIAKPPVVKAARAMSFFGEHAAGWLAIGALGAVVDRKRRKQWDAVRPMVRRLLQPGAVAGGGRATVGERPFGHDQLFRQTTQNTRSWMP